MALYDSFIRLTSTTTTNFCDLIIKRYFFLFDNNFDTITFKSNYNTRIAIG